MSFAYMPLFTGDYLKDTRQLSTTEHGAYILALMHCWDSKGPLPLDEQQCMGICACRSQADIEAMRFVLARFFVRMEGGFFNQRLMQEIERGASISSKRSGAARDRWNARDSLKKMKAMQMHPEDMQMHAGKNVTNSRNPLQEMKAQMQMHPEGVQMHQQAMQMHDETMQMHADANASKTHANAPPLALSPSSPQRKSKEKKEKTSSFPKKGSRLPHDWQPDDAGRALAAKLGLGDGMLTDEIERFRDYWIAVAGAKGLKLDWGATWRNWCRSSADRRGVKAEVYRGKTL